MASGWLLFLALQDLSKMLLEIKEWPIHKMLDIIKCGLYLHDYTFWNVNEDIWQRLTTIPQNWFP